jgi:hypothetical protein
LLLGTNHASERTVFESDFLKLVMTFHLLLLAQSNVKRHSHCHRDGR